MSMNHAVIFQIYSIFRTKFPLCAHTDSVSLLKHGGGILPGRHMWVYAGTRQPTQAQALGLTLCRSIGGSDIHVPLRVIFNNFGDPLW